MKYRRSKLWLVAALLGQALIHQGVSGSEGWQTHGLASMPRVPVKLLESDDDALSPALRELKHGIECYFQGNLELAIQHLSKARENGRDDDDRVTIWLAFLHYSASSSERAFEILSGNDAANSDPWGLWFIAGMRHHLGDVSKARKCYEKAVDLARLDGDLRLSHIQFLCDVGTSDDVLEAVQDLLVAIPSQRGGYVHASGFPIDPDRLAHGHEQVDRMLSDRQNMRLLADQVPELKDWAARRFAGEFMKHPAYWSAEMPDGFVGGDACYLPERETNPSLVYVGQNRSDAPLETPDKIGEWQWSAAVFELMNMQNSESVIESCRLAQTKLLNEQGFMDRVVYTEYITLKKVRTYYACYLGPICKERGLRLTPTLWRVTTDRRYTDFINGYPNHARYPFGVYSEYYRRLTHQN